MNYYPNYDFRKDTAFVDFIFSGEAHRYNNGKSLIENCVDITLNRLKSINKLRKIKYELIFTKEDIINYFEIKLASIIFYYCFDKYINENDVLSGKNDKLTKEDINKFIRKDYILNAINDLFSKKISIIEDSKKFGLDNKLMNNKNVKLLSKYSYSYSLDKKNNIKYTYNYKDWKKLKKKKRKSAEEHACFMVFIRKYLLDEFDKNDGISILRNFFFESATNLSLLSYISKKIIEVKKIYEDSALDYIVEALVFTTHIDVINARERYVDYILNRKINNENDVHEIKKEISYICDFALPFIIDYNFNLMKVSASKNYIYDAITNMDIISKITNTPLIFLEKEVLIEYKERTNYASFFYCNLEKHMNEIYYKYKYDSEEITLERIISKVVEDWYESSRYKILLEKEEVAKYFLNQIIIKDIINADKTISLNKASNNLANIKADKLDIENYARRYQDFFHNHFKNESRLINPKDYSLESNPKDYQKYEIPMILISLQDIDFLIKEEKLLADYKKINTFDDLYENIKEIKGIVDEYLVNISCSNYKEFLRDEVERKYGISLTHYIYNECNKIKNDQDYQNLLKIYSIPEINSRNRYVDYYYDNYINSKRNREEFLKEIEKLKQETFDMIQYNINLLLENVYINNIDIYKNKKVVY